MRVFVAGGSGAIGRQLVPKLVAEGHSVVATARSSAKLAEIRAWGANAIVMDGLDQASVQAAVAAARPEMIVHQMTALADCDGPAPLRSQVRVDQPSAHRRDPLPARRGNQDRGPPLGSTGVHGVD